jgi:Sec-independent protein translocase protein TatA
MGTSPTGPEGAHPAVRVYAPARVLAFFDSLGWQEMFLLLVIGLLLYGRNLPEAGRNLGRVMAKLKRHFDDFKRQMDRDADLREMKDTLKDAAKDLKRAADAPRALTNPVHMAKTMAKDALLAPAPETVAEPADGATEPQPAEAADHDHPTERHP